MKIRMILIIGLMIFIFGSDLKYLDLSVSEKYETQLEGLNPTENKIKKAEELKGKIEINCAITIHSLQNEVSFYMIQKIEKGD
ncbi:hypothetical protein [Elizabethkingia ursingii]|uniref:hypothetical protein n=1 Tax=Elizabethkingia ursingii TaxID=1756150 RepID=UPI00075175A4|nr:hypothetical protein [Elizabethkingia ursingii]KUY30398.1 hypothetical protein ATB96_01790 [Elizabethkingia ursingii]